MTPLDRHVGRRIKGKRRALGLAADDLAKSLGVSGAVVRAYERGTERVPSEQLVRLSEIMDVPLSYFFPVSGPDSPSDGATSSAKSNAR
jgi:transcriptional regulator with XRE-family HTH domain